MPPLKNERFQIMKCVTPMYRIYYPNDPEATGKIISRKEAMEKLEGDHNFFRNHKKWLSKDGITAMQLVPCKHCWACHLNYSAEWATRILLEAKKTPDQNWFITLTYDDEHLPIAEKIEAEEGTFTNDGTWGGTLVESEMIRFLNTLRKEFERNGYTGIKYFYCGEYGETTHRPHFHIILLHCPLDIGQFYDCHVDGKNFKAHWKSHEIENIWAVDKLNYETGEIQRIPKGIVDVAELEWSCAAYVARYCTKKLTYDRDKTKYYEQGKMPEFIRMSRGLGFDWYKEHKNEIYKNDELIMKTVKGNVGSMKPPKAFDRKMKEQFPEWFDIIKKSRETAAERAEQMLLSQSDYTDYENLIKEARKVEEKMKLLPRVGEW